jgi:uridylate kinase
MTQVLSLGGSIVAPDGPDPRYVADFVRVARAWLARKPEARLVVVVGGGSLAREYQRAYRELGALTGGDARKASDAQDWIGVMTTRVNAELVKAAFGDDCADPVVTDPTGPLSFTGRVLVGAGWKPGFSTDFDAILLASRLGASSVANLSNIAKVYTADPKVDPNAKPIDAISWPDFRRVIGDEWSPGKNAPFDPVASREAERLGIKVKCASGKDLSCVEAILDDKPFFGTVIG